MSRAPIHLRPWTAGDERKFTPRADMAAESEALAWDWSKGAPGPTWVVVRFPREVLGIGGGWPVPDEPGHFEAWCLIADVARGDMGQCIECAALVLAKLERAHGARKISALVANGYGAGRRTLEHLGFTRAGASQWEGYSVMQRHSAAPAPVPAVEA